MYQLTTRRRAKSHRRFSPLRPGIAGRCWPEREEGNVRQLAVHDGERFDGIAASAVIHGPIGGSKIVNKSGEGVVMDIILGVIGAVAGGWLFNMLGHSGVTGLNLYSLFVAVIGAVIVLVVSTP